MNHQLAVRGVAPDLFDQSEFPIEVSLHGLGLIVGALVRRAITVDQRQGQTRRPLFQRQSTLQKRRIAGRMRVGFQFEDAAIMVIAAIFECHDTQRAHQLQQPRRRPQQRIA